jgi:hypothetical protein
MVHVGLHQETCSKPRNTCDMSVVGDGTGRSEMRRGLDARCDLPFEAGVANTVGGPSCRTAHTTISTMIMLSSDLQIPIFLHFPLSSPVSLCLAGSFVSNIESFLLSAHKYSLIVWRRYREEHTTSCRDRTDTFSSNFRLKRSFRCHEE